MKIAKNRFCKIVYLEGPNLEKYADNKIISETQKEKIRWS